MTNASAPVYCSEGIAILGGSALEGEGWVRRTVTDQTRIKELIEVYSSLGFETRVTGLDPASFGDACTTCATSACRSYLAIFTRPAAITG